MTKPVRIEAPATTRTAERIVDLYVRGAFDIREGDLEDFLGEVERYPDEIVDEVVASAEDRGLELTRDLHSAIVAEAEAFTRTARRRMRAEAARVAGERAVAAVND